MTIFAAIATNANGVDATISVDSETMASGGQTSQQEKAVAQLVLDVDLWRSDTSVVGPT